MQPRIEGIGLYMPISLIEKTTFSSLSSEFSEALYNVETGHLLLMSKKHGGLYLCGETKMPRHLLQDLATSLDTEGLLLSSIIPIGIQDENIFGFVRVGRKSSLAKPSLDTSLFVDMDIEHFTNINAERVLLGQYFDVIFEHSGIKQILPRDEVLDGFSLLGEEILTEKIEKLIVASIARDIIDNIEEVDNGLFKIVK